MKRVYVYCEGQTEESFVTSILAPYLAQSDITTIPIVCKTKHTNNRSYKGGVASYSKIRDELRSICHQHKNELITTMLDYYGLPRDTPGLESTEKELYKRIDHIEKTIQSDIGADNCVINLMVHEFEALLFSDPNAFGIISPEVADAVQSIKIGFKNPEHINNSQSTAPSKRLMNVIENYSKRRTGVIIAKRTGIERMIEECPHFNQWLEQIISFRTPR